MKLLDKDILYKDNHVVAVYKPPGVVTQEEFQEAVKEWVARNYGKTGKVFLEPVHRLDKPVSGIVLFAKTSKALSRLNAQMRGHEIERVYVARVCGQMQGSGRLIHRLKREPFRSVVDPEGKEAILDYRARDDGWVEVRLVTGRYHQIRCQLAACGHPICGDEKYGGDAEAFLQLLHQRMSFKHPTTGAWVEINCPFGIQSR